ncbi:hypothetical protein [Thalassotalea sp. ND16A]|uniref:hypothetical protein n=1 Tax=Thalassotalea sp. ND16A TaxID=1535422 RepID=UPI00051D2D44|nr:hypothetical protein [Thalassotalea sp. ND16A]KGJ89427.1 hypothetical protein ND16A_2320 [Thalassotalea sp. ND16A]
MHLHKILFLSSFCLLLCSCVVKPTVTTEYDNKCQIVKKKVELSVEQVELFEQLNCSGNDECKAEFLGQVVGAAVVFPLSAIVSGSIAVVGNTVYWLNEQGQCLVGN